MGEIRGELYGVVMGFLPEVDPAKPGNREHILRATRLLADLSPLMNLVDEQVRVGKGEVNEGVVASFLADLLRLEDGGSLSVKMIAPADAGNLPTDTGGYQLLFNRLLDEEFEHFLDGAGEKLGAEVLTRLRDQLMLKLYLPLAACLIRQYEEFFEGAELSLATNLTHGCFTLVSTFLIAVILDDQAAVAWLKPIICQLSLCLPVGALGNDPLDCVVLTPG
jgi:hypothetical protein